MIFAPLEMDRRDCPAADLGGGMAVLSPALPPVRPFADWSGPLAVFDAGDRVWVGAGPGGGPRVAVFDPATGARDRPDWFAGDPASRSGVVFVAPELPAPPPLPAGVPALTYGDPADPNVFTVYVDFENDPTPDYVRAAMGALWEWGRLVGDLAFTTTRPDDRPDRYGTAVVGAPLGWTAPFANGRPFGGETATTWMDGEPFMVSEAVLIDTRFVLTGRDAGLMLRHEIGNGFGAVLPGDRDAEGQPLAGKVRAGVGAALAARPGRLT